LVTEEAEYSLPPVSLYIHFPWCIQKCPYCDFNSHSVKSGIPEVQYVDALLADLRVDLQLLSAPCDIASNFMGGGTPSLFSPRALDALLEGVRTQVRLAADCEITLEANPGTFESARFSDFRALGINRLSIGIQSFSDKHLKALGRVHDAAEAFNAVEIARRAGFENLNLDLMFGLPEQTEAEAIADVDTAIALQPTHISFYQLTLEPNTYFYKFPPQLPEHDGIFSLQTACQQRLAAAGYQQYEVSAYAKPGFQCRHNRNYWQFGDYLGIGAGAHGKISRILPGDILRTAKAKGPEQYLQGTLPNSPVAIAIEHLPLEYAMNALRLKGGFDLRDYERRTGLHRDSLQPALQECLTQQLLIQQQTKVCCSNQGWDFLDEILEKFIP
jgi:putative oxygen-independent coproporphyrinogen III oxidase